MSIATMKCRSDRMVLFALVLLVMIPRNFSLIRRSDGTRWMMSGILAGFRRSRLARLMRGRSSPAGMCWAWASRTMAATWQQTLGFLNYQDNDITFHPADPNTIWIGTLGGPYKSTDGGIHWTLKAAGHAADQQGDHHRADRAGYI